MSGKPRPRSRILITSDPIYSYLSVDYERGVFNVSACTWNENPEQNIVTITPEGSGSSNCSGSECSSGNGGSGSPSPLSRGAVAGIAIAALVGVIILAAAFFFFVRRQRQRAAYKATPPETDVSVLTGPVHNFGPPSPPHTDNLTPQGRFWSPDTISGGPSGSNGKSSGHDGESSNDAVNRESSADEHGVELDSTQIKPVYHELPGSEVLGMVQDPGSVVRRVRTSYAA